MNARDRKLIDFVAKQAHSTLSTLTVADRIRLLDGITLIASAAEAEQCQYAADCYRQAEESQLILGDMLSEKIS